MDIERIQCISCGNISTDNQSDLDQCGSCGSKNNQMQRCAWCSQWSAESDYCEHCGTVIADKTKYGASRILKKRGVDQVSISIQLNKCSETELIQLEDEFEAHAKIASQLVSIAKFCAQYLYNPNYYFEFEDRLVKDLPFDMEIFDHLRKGSIPKEKTIGVQLNAIATTCQLQELAELATIASVKYPETIIDSASAKQWLERVSKVALGEGINVIEALIALAHWRSWVAPFYFDIYRGDLSKKIYNTAYAKLFNCEGLQATWMAVLCAKTEYFQKLKSSNKTKRTILKLLNEGLSSKSKDLMLSCAILLNDELVFAKLVNSDNPEIKQVSLKVLSHACSSKLAPIIENADSSTLMHILDGMLAAQSDEAIDIPESVVAAFCNILDKLDSDFLNQVIKFITDNSNGKEKYYKIFSKFISKHDDPSVSVDLLFDANKNDPLKLQQMLLQSEFKPELIDKIEALAEKTSFIPEFADQLIRFIRKTLLSDQFEKYKHQFYTIISSQLSVNNTTAFVFKRFVIEGLVHSNPLVANRMFDLVYKDLQLITELKTQVDNDNSFYSVDFCENYMGSVDNMLLAINGVLAHRKEYKCSQWLLQTLFQNEINFKTLLAENPAYTKEIFKSLIRAYVKEPNLRDVLLTFMCAPLDKAKQKSSPFFDAIEVSDFDNGLLDLLVNASEKYLFSKRLLIEALQYFELSQDKKYLETIQLILANQCNQEPAFAYYCISYLVRNCFNTENLEQANNAYSVLSYINSSGIIYLGPKDNIAYKLNDLGNFIRNFFNSLEDFSELFKKIILNKQVFGVELWLLSGFKRNEKVISSRYLNHQDLLAKLVIAVATQTIDKKYNKTSQNIVIEFLKDYMSFLPISNFILNNTRSVLSDLNTGEEPSEAVLTQLRLLISEYQKSEGLASSEISAAKLKKQDSSNSKFLEKMEFGHQPIDIDFEVSVVWLRKFDTLIRNQGIANSLSLLGLFHNHAQAFKAILEGEAELQRDILDSLIDLVFQHLDYENSDDMSQKLLASELIYALAKNSSITHYCIRTIKDKLSSLSVDAGGAECAHYIQRVLNSLSEIRLDQISRDKYSKVDKASKIKNEPVKRRLPSYSQAEIKFDIRELKNQFEGKKLKQRLMTGVGLINSHDYIEAIDQFKSMLDIEVSDRVYYLIGKAYLLYDLPEQASKYIEKCLVLNPNNWRALILYAFQQEYIENNIQFAETLVKRAYAIEPKSDRVLARISSINLKRSKHTVAMKFIQEALKVNPNNAEIYFLLGELLQKTKRYKESIQYYKKAISLGAEDPCVYSAMGVSEFKLGNVVDGVQKLKQALKIDQSCAIAHFGLGEIFSSSGDADKAELHLSRACEFDSNNNSYKMRLAEHYQVLEENEKALDIMMEIANNGEPVPSNLIQIARLCAKNNRVLHAQDYLEKAISLQPENYTLYFELALLYEETQAFGNAVGILQRVVELKPDFIDAWLKMGDIYKELSRRDESQKCYQEVLTLDKSNSLALLGMGNLFSHAGDNKRAEKYFKKANRNKSS